MVSLGNVFSFSELFKQLYLTSFPKQNYHKKRVLVILKGDAERLPKFVANQLGD